MTITLDLFSTPNSPFRSDQESFMLSLLGLNEQGAWIISNNGKRAEFVLPGASQTSIIFTGNNFVSNGPALVSGTIKTAELIDFSTGEPSVKFAGLSIDVDELFNDINSLKAGGGLPGENADALQATYLDDTRTVVNGSKDAELIQGGNKTDTLNGGGGDDIFNVTSGNDVMNGNKGNDSVSFVFVSFLGVVTYDMKTGEIKFADGTSQTATNFANVTGSSAGSIISGNNAANTLSGNDAPDSLSGKGGNDIISGGGGRDTLSGNGGNDFIRGGDRRDSIEGDDGDDELFGDSGQDTIGGGDGNDFIDGGIDSDELFGDDGKDKIFGDHGRDLAVGGKKNDKLEGGAGNDTLKGGAGADTLKGGNGTDTLKGGDGNDVIKGGAKSDSISSGEGFNTLSGGVGDDFFAFSGLSDEAVDIITDFSDDDLIALFVQNGNLVSVLGQGTTTIEYSGGTIILEGVSANELRVLDEDGEIFIDFI